MKIAFYKVARPGLLGLFGRLTRWWERGPYSHCELIFSDGIAASSSFIDGGVRFKAIDFDPAHWDFIELPRFLEPAARAWFKAHEGEKYDVLGDLHFVIGSVASETDKQFCSKAAAAALGMQDAWRYEPNVLAATLRYTWVSAVKALASAQAA